MRGRREEVFRLICQRQKPKGMVHKKNICHVISNLFCLPSGKEARESRRKKKKGKLHHFGCQAEQRLPFPRVSTDTTFMATDKRTNAEERCTARFQAFTISSHPHNNHHRRQNH